MKKDLLVCLKDMSYLLALSFTVFGMFLGILYLNVDFSSSVITRIYIGDKINFWSLLALGSNVCIFFSLGYVIRKFVFIKLSNLMKKFKSLSKFDLDYISIRLYMFLSFALMIGFTNPELWKMNRDSKNPLLNDISVVSSNIMILILLVVFILGLIKAKFVYLKKLEEKSLTTN